MKSVFTFLFLILVTIQSSLATDPPGLLLPADSSENFAEVLFQWTVVSGASSYEFQADSSLSFNSGLLIDSNFVALAAGLDNILILNQLHFGVNYFWRVRTITAVDTSAWSTPFSFSTRDSLLISSPAFNLEFESKVKLDWDAFPGATYYDIQLDTSNSFNSTALQISSTFAFSSQNNSFDTEATFIHLYFGKTHYWRVRARNDADTTVWTSSQFIVKESIEITAVNGATQDQGTKLNWDAYERVQYYDFHVDIDPGFTSAGLISGSTFYISTSDNNTDTEYSPYDLQFDSYYYWRVRGRHNNDTSIWTSDFFHTYPTVDLNTPLNAAVVDVNVMIDWQPHTGVDYYVYQVDITDQFNSPSLINGQNLYFNAFDGNSDTEEEIQNLKFGTTYFWRVRAVNSTDESAWSEIRTFTTVNSVEQMYPLDNTSNFTQIDFSWVDIDGIVNYQIQLDSVISFNSNILLQYSNGSQAHKVIPNLFFGENYYWRVRAMNAVDTSEWSDIRTFYTYDLPGLFTPDLGALAVDTAVMLDWMHHTGAVMYQLEVDSSNTFSTGWLIQSNQLYLGASSGLPDTQYWLSGLDEDQFYFWRVRVLNEKDTSQWESRWFSTGNAPLVLPQTPVLIAPLHNETHVSTDPELWWTAISGAAGYHYQFSTDMDFSNDPVLFATGNQVALTSLDYVSDYYWRVRTFDGNLVSDWSSVFHFTTDQEQLIAPQLITPLYGAYSQSVDQLNFDWNSVYHAQYYIIQLSTTDNFLFDLIQEQVSTSFFEAFTLLPGKDYFWRVRAMNDTLINSEWSEVWTFSTLAVLETPQLISPINTSVEQAYNNLMLEWQEIILADGYEIEYAKDEYFLVNPEHEVNVVNYFVVSSLDPAATYYWRVRAIADTMYHSDWSYVWSFTTRDLIDIQDVESECLKVYPNPVTDIMNLESGKIIGRMELMTIDGKVVFTQKIDAMNYRLEMSQYPAGVYYLRIEKQELIKFIKLD